LCETCTSHFAAVKTYLTDREVPFEIRPRLVRGLDYYMRTTFEIVHGSLGAQNSVLGGGRYDGLAEALGSKIHSPGIGFSIGEDRLVMTVAEQFPNPDSVELFIAPMGEDAFRQCSLIAREIRRKGSIVELAPAGKLKKLMETANKTGAKFTLLVGDDEIASGTYTLKNMTTGEQEKLGRRQLTERF
jgi:histidyl-tRNA synthetase